MTIPNSIIFVVRYPDGEDREVTWDSEGLTGHTYSVGVLNMEAQVYECDVPEIGTIEWGIVNNRDTDEDATEKALTEIFKALTLKAIKDGPIGEGGPQPPVLDEVDGVSWPLTTLMLIETDGRHRPRGMAASIRLINSSLVSSTDIGLPVYFRNPPPPDPPD